MCKGWDLNHDLREDQSIIFTGSIMGENSQHVLRHTLESSTPTISLTVDDGADKEIFDKIRDAYSACLDESELQKIGSGPLLDILLKIEELFPASRPGQIGNPFVVMNDQLPKGITSKGENDLSVTMAYLMRIGVDTLVSFDVQV